MPYRFNQSLSYYVIREQFQNRGLGKGEQEAKEWKAVDTIHNKMRKMRLNKLQNHKNSKLIFITLLFMCLSTSLRSSSSSSFLLWDYKTKKAWTYWQYIEHSNNTLEHTQKIQVQNHQQQQNYIFFFNC